MTPGSLPRRRAARRGRLLVRVLVVVGVLLGVAPAAGQVTHVDVGGVALPTGAATASAERTVGGVPLDEILAAAQRHARCGIGPQKLAAFMIAPIFRESGAPATQAPSPMTMSRWDNQAALYSFGNTTTYRNAFWHPGISPWQWDDASLQGLTSYERIDSRFVADFTARFMIERWCQRPGDYGYLWMPWHACAGGECTKVYNEIYDGGLRNLRRDTSVGRYGGMVPRTCTLNGSSPFTCWFIDPSKAQGHTGWAAPNAGPAPITKPFYAFASGGYEQRHWLRAHTGYTIDIQASLRLGLNSRTSLTWTSGSALCDLTTGVGTCDPVPAGFRLTGVNVSGTSYAPFSGDFGGDGRDDIFWYGPGTAFDTLWLGRANRTFASASVLVEGSYTPISGDFDGDGYGDVLWYGQGPARDGMWRGRPIDRFRWEPLNVAGSYLPIAGDFDGDGRDDIFWYGPGTARDSLWLGRPNGFVHRAVTVNGTYLPFAGDFDGDGRDDIFWYGPGSAFDTIWLGRRDGAFASRPIKVSGVYLPVPGDFDGDGRTDVVWYGRGTAADSLWWAKPGLTFKSAPAQIQRVFWPIAGDFDGDGRDDIFWYGPGDAADRVWWAG